MNLKNSFEIPADRDTAWSVLLDIPRIAPCMPGAELTEIVGERTYKGLARVKVGPVALQFAGEAEITHVNNVAYQAVVHAKGADGKGRGTADASVSFQLVPAGEASTRVDVDTDLNLTGAVAQYGRASGLIDAVAKQIIADFVENLKAELARLTATMTEVAGVTAIDDAGTGVDASTEGPPVMATKPTAPAKPVSGLSLLLRAIVSIVAGWFKRADGTTTGGKQ